jgi:two-component system, NarL family, nitrate/nitrite response regulator NarL
LFGDRPPTKSDRSGPARLVLADSHAIFRASLRQLLSVPANIIKEVYAVDVGSGFQVVGEAGSGDEVMRVVDTVEPELLLLDSSMPRASMAELLSELQRSRPALRTLLLVSKIENPQLLSAVQLGARGVILKDASTELLFTAMTAVIAGHYWLGPFITDFVEMVRPLIESSRGPGGKLSYGLTPREREVVMLVAAGHANKEIARRCSVSQETVKHHLTRIFDKVGASNRTELAMFAAQHGFDALPL